ncbi:winged helix-turn-helix domain-containing protein [Myceligenerans salitolerans]|uniref:Winged helix-turn-helix transcriptional regulator n=1 Tax=Myceligenerans salitolerans TaxID=1230528 RepID=A0ABS3I8M0_9MICO|nr:winged helix-turn-helix domain-containing protein [Myceligenerans salitolerans]MBO0609371.1 winged helix-turn-helix transcriptional regulator [Myceligenerans salitolerans]
MTTHLSGKELAEKFRRQIDSGELPDDAKLPSNAELMNEYGISATVVRDAFAALMAEGLVIGHQGKGRFVVPASQRRPRTTTSDLDERVSRLEARVAALEEAGSKS